MFPTSSGGTINIWDTLTLNLLRTFHARRANVPMYEQVDHIVLESKRMIAAVGSRILAWEPGMSGAGGKSKGRNIVVNHSATSRPLSIRELGKF